MNQRLRSWATIVVIAVLLTVTTWLLLVEPSRNTHSSWERVHTSVALPVETSDALTAVEDSDDQDSDDTHTRNRFIDEQAVIELSLEEQRIAGIKTAHLAAMSYRPETKAYGEVLDVQELLELRTRYDAARSEKEIYAAELQASLHEYQRLRKLGKQGKIVSPQQLKVSESNWLRDKARLESASIKQRNVRDQAVQVWGHTLGSMALSEKSKQFDRLINHLDVLVLVTLLPGQSLAKTTSLVFVGRTANRNHAREARLISAATHTDDVTQGETYLFLTDGEQFRTGMRLVVWIPKTQSAHTGVYLPAESVVWYAGKPWSYVRISDVLFVRRSVPKDSELDGGWIVRDGFEANEQIVVDGTQSLLSEEFRWQIPEEDTD